MHMDDLIKSIIEENFSPEEMTLVNESHKHAGHAGDDGSGQTHYKLMVASQAFANMSRIQRQREVLNCLKIAFDQGLHAISLNLTVSN